MSAAEKIEHESEHEGAANNADFFDKNFEPGGLLPLLGRIGSLALGVVAQAPIDAVRGRGDAAHAKPHDAAHDPHKKEHDKAHDKKDEAAKEGEAGHAKKEGGHGHGITQENVGDAYAIAKSAWDIFNEAKEGKLDKHSFEHAVSNVLDAANLGWARPLADIGGSIAMAGFAKIFKIREHKLEAIDPQWDTLGSQILTLKKDKKHGYHHAVEGLCHGINASDLEEKFDCFTSKEAFEAALKTDGGKEEIKAQLARIIGTTKNPNSANVKKRIERIEKILGTHVHHSEVKYHDDKAPENEKEKASLDALTLMLHHMKGAMTEEAIKQLYHGEKAEKMTIDYDKFGDYVFEHVKVDSNENRTAFFKAFDIRAFENTFRLLLDGERLTKALKKGENRKAAREQLYGLFDLDNGVDAKDLDRQADALKKTLGLGGTPAPGETTTQGALLKNITTVVSLLKADSNLEKLFVEEEKIPIDYENFGDIVLEKVSGKISAEAFYESFKADIFQTKFEVLANERELQRALKQPEGKEEIKSKIRQLFNMSGSIGLEALVARREKLLALLEEVDSAASKTKHAELKRLTEVILKNLGWDFMATPTAGPKPGNVWDKLYEEKPQVIQPRYSEFGKHLREMMAASNTQESMVAFVRGYNSNLFRNEFPYLVDKSMMANALQNEPEGEQAKRQLLVFLGLSTATATLPQVQRTLAMFKGVQGAEASYPDDLKGSGKNYKTLEADIAAIETVLSQKEIVEQLFGGVKIKPAYEKLGRQILELDEKKLQSLLSEINVAGLFTSYSSLHALIAGAPKTDPTLQEGKAELLKLMGYPEGYPLDKRKLEERLQSLAERIKNAGIVSKNPGLGKDLLNLLGEFIEKVKGETLEELLRIKMAA